MKRNVFLAIALAALCGTALAAPKKAKKAEKVPFPQTEQLGNVMFVGDSITHGVAAASYRWPLFKIWVDNGIEMKEVGVHAKNHSGGVRPDSPYGTATFLNVHSAISSERAYEIAGRINKSGRLENSNIHDWLGLDKGYTGKRRIDPATQMPDTYIMMIGTNDTLSDAGQAGIHTCIDAKEKDLLGKGGDLDTIIAAMREGKKDAHIAVTTIPTWAPGRNNNAAPGDFAAIEQYNEKLKDWGKEHKVAIVEVNKGMVDVKVRDEKKIPFVGAVSMFGRDKLHPSAQGDLIIAGNIAQQLGYAGRTAGLKRKALPVNTTAEQTGITGVQNDKAGSYEFGKGGSLSFAGAEGQGATVEFRFPKKGYGDGAKGGWDTENPLTVTLGACGSTGTLSISEAHIQWNGTTLYSADMSKMGDTIRMAYVAGAPAKGLEPGFYVWLGDMLIGEGLAGTAGGEAGLTLSAGLAANIAGFRYDPAASWAPESKLFSHGNPLIESSAAAVEAPADEPGTLTIRSMCDVTKNAKGGGLTLSGGKDTTHPRKLVFDGAGVSAKAITPADFDEIHLTNGSAVVLTSLGGAKKLIVDATSRLGLTAGEHEASVLNSGSIILPKGATLSLRPEGTDENETGTYTLNGGVLQANNVRMSNAIIVKQGGEASGLSPETFRGKLEKR